MGCGIAAAADLELLPKGHPKKSGGAAGAGTAARPVDADASGPGAASTRRFPQGQAPAQPPAAPAVETGSTRAAAVSTGSGAAAVCTAAAAISGHAKRPGQACAQCCSNSCQDLHQAATSGHLQPAGLAATDGNRKLVAESGRRPIAGPSPTAAGPAMPHSNARACRSPASPRNSYAPIPPVRRLRNEATHFSVHFRKRKSRKQRTGSPLSRGRTEYGSFSRLSSLQL